MTALAAERNTLKIGENVLPKKVTLQVAASTKIYAGGIVALNSSGYAVPASASTTQIAAGRAMKTVDNSSGGAGALTVDVECGCFKYGNSASGDLIGITEIGKDCYLVDDQTVAKTNGGSTRSRAGKVIAVDSDGVTVCIGLGV